MNNFAQIDQQLTAWVDAHKGEIVQNTRRLLQIPSVEGEPEPGAPFGIETRRALDLALGIAAEYGLTTKDLDGYAGHAEWTAPGVAPDAEIVGVLAHVDVVPAGDGWKHDPFGAEIENGNLYARGATDDKGPAMAALYALIAVKECGAPLARRLRLILGADEESGFGCVKHYFAHEEMPATGFTPDAMFPLVYAEKGIADAVVTKSVPLVANRIHLVSLSGGLRSNMVPDSAVAILEENPPTWEIVQARLNAVVGISTEVIDSGRCLRVRAKGIAAHGSTPNEGVNAVVLLCDALLLLDHTDDAVALIQQIRDWGQDTTGAALGIAGADEIAGPLTCNLGKMSYEDGQASLTFNVRYPVTWTSEILRARLEPVVTQAGFTLSALSNNPPLHIPLDDPLVTTLLEIYRVETGDDSPPLTMGGGTYARAMAKGIAFGPSFPGDVECAHQADEFWPIDSLIRVAKIYAKAIVRLANP